jgi:hypothetical protein
MAEGNNQKTASDFASDFQGQLWAAADRTHEHMKISESCTFAPLPKSLSGGLRKASAQQACPPPKIKFS